MQCAEMLLMKTANEIIDAFGGTVAMAEVCDVYPSAVSQWRATRIPRARLMYLKLLRPDIFEKPPTEERKANV